MLDVSSGSLSRRLASHLAALDLAEGTHLIEQTLAEAMGVSRTPIRRVLAEFVNAGIVYSAPRRGYFLAISSRTLFTSGLEFDVSDEQDLFDRIALDRLSMELSELFSERDIIDRYRVSSRLAQRTLQTLRDEDVIKRASKGLWGFNPFLLTREASDASYAYRLLLEPQVPLLATFRPRTDLIRRCRDEHVGLLALPAKNRTGRLAFRVDAMFHETLATCGGNPFIRSSIAQQNRLRQLLEYRDSSEEARIVAWVREHLDILDAVTSGKLDQASRLMETHLRNALSHRANKSGETRASDNRRAAPGIRAAGLAASMEAPKR